jgi:hypothetical protein
MADLHRFQQLNNLLDKLLLALLLLIPQAIADCLINETVVNHWNHDAGEQVLYNA